MNMNIYNMQTGDKEIIEYAEDTVKQWENFDINKVIEEDTLYFSPDNEPWEVTLSKYILRFVYRQDR